MLLEQFKKKLTIKVTKMDISENYGKTLNLEFNVDTFDKDLEFTEQVKLDIETGKLQPFYTNDYYFKLNIGLDDNVDAVTYMLPDEKSGFFPLVISSFNEKASEYSPYYLLIVSLICRMLTKEVHPFFIETYSEFELEDAVFNQVGEVGTIIQPIINEIIATLEMLLNHHAMFQGKSKSDFILLYSKDLNRLVAEKLMNEKSAKSKLKFVK